MSCLVSSRARPRLSGMPDKAARILLPGHLPDFIAVQDLEILTKLGFDEFRLMHLKPKLFRTLQFRHELRL